MAGNLKKFVNPRFIKTIDLALMKPLLARHEGKYKSFSVDLLDQEDDAAREDLQTLLTGAEESYPEGLRGDLHRIAELGDARGLDNHPDASEASGHRFVPGHEDRRRGRAQQGARAKAYRRPGVS